MPIRGDILLKKAAASLGPPGHSLAPASGPGLARHGQFHGQRPGSAPSVRAEPAGRPRPSPPSSTLGNLRNNNKNNKSHTTNQRTRPRACAGSLMVPLRSCNWSRCAAFPTPTSPLSKELLFICLGFVYLLHCPEYFWFCLIQFFPSKGQKKYANFP